MTTPTDRSPAIRTITDRLTLSDGSEVATTTLEPSDRDNDQVRLGEVIICHGTPWSSHMWLPLARELAQTKRVRLWDMPGYGESIPATSGESIPAPAGTSAQPTDDPLAEATPAVDLITQRRRLAELIDCWTISDPHVIAHDIGGAVALGAHLLEGSDFASLYLLDVVTLDPWGSPFFRLVAENEKVFAALRPEHTAPIVDRLGEARCPVRIGWGADDPWIPANQADRLAEALPHRPHVTRFPRTGHLVPLEAPHDLHADVTAWLHG